MTDNFIPLSIIDTVGPPDSKDERRRAYLRSSHPFPKVYEYKAMPLPVDFRSASACEVRIHELDLYVTMRCNIRCQFCTVRAGEYSHQDLPIERILTIIDEAVDLGLEEIHFLGGEPTLRQDLEQMVAHAASIGLYTRIITNGMMLPRSRIMKLIDAGLKEIMISVDGFEKTHTRLRMAGPDGWRTTMTCAQDSIDLGLRTRLSMVAYSSNEAEIIPLMELAESMGGHIFSVFLGSPLGRGHLHMIDQVIDAYHWRELQDQIAAATRDLRRDFQVVVEAGFAWPDGPSVDRSILKGRGTGCNTLLEDFDYLIVRSDGNLYQCVFFMTEGKPIGNIWDQPLRETLQFAREQAVYHSFTVANDRCMSCYHQEACGTGCRGYSYLYKEDWLKTDPRCIKNDPNSMETPDYYPLCPILKANLRTGHFGGSTEQALKHSLVAQEQ
jgi:radical SAM protein with 4Fe4S-binding SPASM domain